MIKSLISVVPADQSKTVLLNKMRPIVEEEKKFVGWKYGSSSSIIVGNSAKFDNNHIRDFRIQSIGVTSDRLEQLYFIDVKQYAMSRAQYEYELARREISDEMGGIFAPLPSELFTNITCNDNKHRAIGYVGVGMLQRGQLWINSNYVRYTEKLRLLPTRSCSNFLLRSSIILGTVSPTILNLWTEYGIGPTKEVSTSP